MDKIVINDLDFASSETGYYGLVLLTASFSFTPEWSSP